MYNKEYLKSLSTWMGFVGIMTIIGGVLTAIAGVFAFIIGAIPGIITTILGVKLRGAKKYTDELIAASDDTLAYEKLNLVTMNLSTYFKIQGVLIIISLVFAVLGIIVMTATGFSIYNYNSFNGYY